jgi:hypothetical protein
MPYPNTRRVKSVPLNERARALLLLAPRKRDLISHKLEKAIDTLAKQPKNAGLTREQIKKIYFLKGSPFTPKNLNDVSRNEIRRHIRLIRQRRDKLGEQARANLTKANEVRKKLMQENPTEYALRLAEGFARVPKIKRGPLPTEKDLLNPNLSPRKRKELEKIIEREKIRKEKAREGFRAKLKEMREKNPEGYKQWFKQRVPKKLASMALKPKEIKSPEEIAKMKENKKKRVREQKRALNQKRFEARELEKMFSVVILNEVELEKAKEKLREKLKRIEPRRREIVERFIGLRTGTREKLEDIGKSLSPPISRQAVHQLYRSTLTLLGEMI